MRSAVRLLTLARDLTRRKARDRQGLFVAEGVRAAEAVLEAARAGHVGLEGALVAPALAATPRGVALREALGTALGSRGVADVGADDFAGAADTDTPQGVLVVARRPDTAQPDAGLAALADAARGASPGREMRLLVLDAVQDPGNVGTLVRTAAALGAAGIIALPGTADVWSAKVVRAGMGAHFALPTFHAPLNAFVDAVLRPHDVPLWGADGAGGPVDAHVADAPIRLALALGNEGNGLTPALRTRAATLVSVPATGAVESLNAAVAGAILLYALRPGVLRG